MFGNKGEEQPRFPKVWFIWNLIEALLMVAAGGLAIYFGITKDNGNSSTGPIETTIAAVIGAFIILDGILRILMVLFRYKESQESIWLVGGFEITAGIVVILSHEFFVGLIINFLSVFLMVIGGLLLLFSVLSIVRKAAGSRNHLRRVASCPRRCNYDHVQECRHGRKSRLNRHRHRHGGIRLNPSHHRHHLFQQEKETNGWQPSRRSAQAQQAQEA